MITHKRGFGYRCTLRLPVFRTQITAFRDLQPDIIAALAHLHTALFITEETQGTFFEERTSGRFLRVFLTRLKRTVFLYFLCNGAGMLI